MIPGTYRVYLESDNGYSITIHVPLTASGDYDHSQPRPHLVKSVWVNEYYGEFTLSVGKHNHFRWDGGKGSLTEFLKAPLHLGAVVRCWESDDPRSIVVAFLVRDLFLL